MKRPEESILSCEVNVAHLPRGGRHVRIDPVPDDLRVLSEEHDLVSVDHLLVDLLVAPWKRDGVRITGSLTARVTQTCRVTLEPVSSRIDETIDVVFLPERSKLNRGTVDKTGELLLDPEGDDIPETYSGNSVDVGALTEEFFALAIDPYPRNPDAPEIGGESDSSADDAVSSPFEKLARLKLSR